MKYKLYLHKNGQVSIATPGINIKHGKDDKPVIHEFESTSERADLVKFKKDKGKITIETLKGKLNFERK